MLATINEINVILLFATCFKHPTTSFDISQFVELLKRCSKHARMLVYVKMCIGIVENVKETSSDSGMHNSAITVLHE